MSQSRNKRRNNIRAGVFVSITLILGMLIFGILTDFWKEYTRSTQPYIVSFSVMEGVGTLITGSKVRLGGVIVGAVSSVEPRADDGIPTSKIDVGFELEKQFPLYVNASIHAQAGLLGSGAWLEISSVGSGEVATIDTELIGTSDTMIGQLMGLEAEENISKSLEALRKISEAISDEGGVLNLMIGHEEAKSIRESIESARSTLLSIDSVMSSTKSVWPDWQESVTAILTESTDLPNKMSDTLKDIREAVHDVRSDVLPNVEQATVSLKKSLDLLESMSRTFQKNAPKWSSKISNIVSNVESITHRADAAIEDIKSHPWKLLYRPTDVDIEYGQLNSAVWQLRTALSSMRQTADELAAASLSSDVPEEVAQEFAAIAKLLRENATIFKKAQDAIDDRMKKDFPNR